MKNHVITHRTKGKHLNVSGLLPANCRLITGIAARAISKPTGAVLEEKNTPLCFPQALISDLLQGEEISDLFYSFLHTRSSERESRDCFERDFLPVIVEVLSTSIDFERLDYAEQEALEQRLSEVLETKLSDYLYISQDLFGAAERLNVGEFREFITATILQFLYEEREDIFWHKTQSYPTPKTFDCGNITLLVNGNNFLLRDYMLTANRKAKSLKKELIPFYEPLTVNSSLQTVFKSETDKDLTLKIYIEYNG